MNTNIVIAEERTAFEEERSPIPFFSVVIPAYNAATHIADAVNSVLAQTVSDYEIIVINDGSPDASELERVLEAFGDKIVYLSRPHVGAAAARNAGIRGARGSYIAFLDSDDEWLPNHLSMIKAMLARQPELDLMYGDAVNFGDVEVEGSTTMEGAPSNGRASFEGLVLGRCTVVGSTAVARRQALIDVGLFDENITYAEDFDLWARLAYHGGRIDYQHEVHARRRIHPGNLTADTIASFDAQIKVLKKFIEELELSTELRLKMEAEIEKCYAEIALERCKQDIVKQRYKKAVTELKRANSTYRSRKLSLVIYLLRTVPGLVRRLYLKRRVNGYRLDSLASAALQISTLVLSIRTCAVLLDS